jgi:hypothetical protein
MFNLRGQERYQDVPEWVYRARDDNIEVRRETDTACAHNANDMTHHPVRRQSAYNDPPAIADRHGALGKAMRKAPDSTS